MPTGREMLRTAMYIFASLCAAFAMGLLALSNPAWAWVIFAGIVFVISALATRGKSLAIRSNTSGSYQWVRDNLVVLC